MGYSAYGVGILGVRHAPGVIKAGIVEKDDGCSHASLLPSEMKFCPECGKPREKRITVFIDQYEADEGGDDKLCGYVLVNRGEGFYDNPEFIAYRMTGRIASGDTASMEVPVHPAKHWGDIKAEMRRKLEPLGLWDEEGFGFHVFTYESC